MKIFSPRGHGYLDYLIVIGFLAAPEVFHLDDVPATISYIFSAVHLLITICTNYPFGFARLIPFPLHGILEFVVSIALMALPWLVGFAAHNEKARNFYIGAGASVLLAYLITDYTHRTDS
jgi:hypothetical protein